MMHIEGLLFGKRVLHNVGKPCVFAGSLRFLKLSVFARNFHLNFRKIWIIENSVDKKQTLRSLPAEKHSRFDWIASADS